LIYGVKPEEVEDIKVVIRIRKSKKDRQHNGHNKMGKRTNNHLQKTKDRTTRTPLQIGGEQRCSGKVSSSCSTSDTRRVTVKWHEPHLTWKSCWTKVYVNKHKQSMNSLHNKSD